MFIQHFCVKATPPTTSMKENNWHVLVKSLLIRGGGYFSLYPSRWLFPVPMSNGITQYLHAERCIGTFAILEQVLLEISLEWLLFMHASKFFIWFLFQTKFPLSKSFTSLLFILCRNINLTLNISLKGQLNRKHNKKTPNIDFKIYYSIINLIVDNLSSNVQKYIKIICYKTHIF